MRCKSKTTRAAKKVLRLSDLDHAKRTVLNSLSAQGKHGPTMEIRVRGRDAEWPGALPRNPVPGK